MTSDLITKTITINDRSIKDGDNGQYAKLKDERNLTYTVSEFKKDGTVSKAWENLPRKGECVEIGYVEVDKEFTNDQGEKKSYKARYIRFFNPSDELPVMREVRGNSGELKPRPKPDKL